MTVATSGLSVRARLLTRDGRISESESSETNRKHQTNGVVVVERRFDPDDPAFKYRHPGPEVVEDKVQQSGLRVILVLVFAGLVIVGIYIYGVSPFKSGIASTLKRYRRRSLINYQTYDREQHWLLEEVVRPPKSLTHLDRRRYLEQHFESIRSSSNSTTIQTLLQSWHKQLDEDIVNNVGRGIRWVRPYLLPTITATTSDGVIQEFLSSFLSPSSSSPPFKRAKEFIQVKRSDTVMQWETEWWELLRNGPQAATRGPAVDYTDPHKYTHPNLVLDSPPPPEVYPRLRHLHDLLEVWNPDDDFPGIIHETLMHFNYNNPKEMAMAKWFRDAELPFKVTHVPELLAANIKWTDEYLVEQFTKEAATVLDENGKEAPSLSAAAQESPNNYFCFFILKKWNVSNLGLPPIQINDWSFEDWVQHARYAEATNLSPHKPHFYWQSGVHRQERYLDPSRWSFISKDLPSFSSPNSTFFVFHPKKQKGIQCRFGERGVYAATHYDGGRNSVAMITGAKRYILSPPRECSKLGVWTDKKSPVYRHSLLNYANYKYLNHSDISQMERDSLIRAGQAQAVETVLKVGEVLYIPSHWFHTIISLQKSAQCNVRAGIDHDGHPAFGNRASVETCKDTIL